MPIPKEFKSQYQDEADFITNFLVPLLRRLGFSIVAEYHGGKEFGKDIVFGEIDRFGQVTYHGLQAKYVDSISQSDSNGLVADCNEAFSNPFIHPNTGAEERISSFIVANGGSISPNAQQNFFNSLATPHGGHIRMLDGKTLLALDRWATFSRVEFLGERLTGLKLEIRFNRQLLHTIRDSTSEFVEDAKNPIPIERLSTGAFCHYLQQPIMAEAIDTQVALDYFYKADTSINRVLDHIAGVRSLENKKHLASGLLCTISDVERLGDSLEVAIDTILNSLGPLVTM